MHQSLFWLALLCLFQDASANFAIHYRRYRGYVKRDNSSPLDRGPLLAHPAAAAPAAALITPAPQLIERANEDDTWYVESPFPADLATAWGECHGGGSTSVLCPAGFQCACQAPGTSKCITNTIAGLGAGCTLYAGAKPTPATTTWDLGGATETGWATAWGQCGGVTHLPGGEHWDHRKTQCPDAYGCNCQHTYYSQCIPTESMTNGGDCPANVYDCPTGGATEPPPTATASLWSQCGGTCWTGPTNCPTVDGTAASCWTQTSPTPNGYAMCDTERPAGGNYKIKRTAGPEPTKLPPQARALMQPMWF